MSTFLIYGANGYTGQLITQMAFEQGLSPILAGRSSEKIADLASRFRCKHYVFDLRDEAKLDAVLREVDFVLHCAGPFSLTSDRMVAACLRTKRHYLDITGEIAVFERLAALDQQAKQAGIMLLPGVGFDVVPSDCLAVHLKDRLPSATDLCLAFYVAGRPSHGTLATMTMNVGKGGAIRRDGRITRVPVAWKTRVIDFGEVQRTCVTIPWGDVSTAYYSTGIPNIQVYTSASTKQRRALRSSRYLGWLLSTSLVQYFLLKQIPSGGPTDQERAKGKSYLWGQASDSAGNSVQTRLMGAEGYTLTAQASLAIAKKILSGVHATGFQTPAKCYGKDLILEIGGVIREDL